MQSENSFTYSTQPHAAPMRRKTKYRDDSEIQNDSGLSNLMHDPRVVRGSTHSTRMMSTSLKNEPPGSKKMSRADTQRRKFTTKRSSTPPPISGRMHMDMQTESFLEELTDRAIDTDSETQTQAFMDRPASPLFVPAKTGQDVVTQILPGDLWDFDIEVEPILEVLVGKSLHVAMLELMQEEELEAIYRQQEEFEIVRKIELAEVQRLEAELKRKTSEKERRLEQEVKRVADRQILEEKIAAQYFAQQYLGSLHDGIFDVLEDQGFFYDPLRKEIEEMTMVDILEGLIGRSDYYEASQEIVNELLEAARLKAKEYEKKADLFRIEMIKKNDEIKDMNRIMKVEIEKEDSLQTKKLNDEVEGSVEGDIEPKQEVEE